MTNINIHDIKHISDVGYFLTLTLTQRERAHISLIIRYIIYQGQYILGQDHEGFGVKFE